MNSLIKRNFVHSFIMVKFDSKLDLLTLRNALDTPGGIRMKKGVHANEDFKVIFAPQFKYNEKLTDVATWFINYANGGAGTYDEAAHLDKYYKAHLAKNDMVSWINTRSILKTMHRLHHHSTDEDSYKITHDDFYTIVGRSLQVHVGKAGEWFELAPKSITTMEFLV